MSQSDIAISVRNLSKAYTISHQPNGLQGRRPTFRDTVTNFISDPFKKTPKETFWALKDVSFDLKKGDVVGIIGRNGAGKSTLLKILSRITKPTSGEIDVYGRIGSLLEVGTGFHPELTGRENIFLNGAILGMTRPEIRKQFDAIVDFASVEKFLDTPVKRYSSGMYVRLAFAVAAHLNSEVLVVDEVLAVGDAEFQRKCVGKMKNVAGGGRTVIFVSHSMATVQSLCNRCVYLSSGEVTTVGDVDLVVRKYLDTGTDSVFSPKNGPLKRVSIRQDGQELVVEACWEYKTPVAFPNLGFVVYDYLGTALTGANPVICDANRLDESRTSGRVIGRLSQPRFFDGKYFLSVWFGDGGQDFVDFPKCLSFEVCGMANTRQLSASVVGPIFPECRWQFDSGNDNSLAPELELANLVG